MCLRHSRFAMRMPTTTPMNGAPRNRVATTAIHEADPYGPQIPKNPLWVRSETQIDTATEATPTADAAMRPPVTAVSRRQDLVMRRLTDPSSPAWGRTRHCNTQRISRLRPHVRCSAELGGIERARPATADPRPT
jgi:hypothetical protein